MIKYFTYVLSLVFAHPFLDLLRIPCCFRKYYFLDFGQAFLRFAFEYYFHFQFCLYQKLIQAITLQRKKKLLLPSCFAEEISGVTKSASILTFLLGILGFSIGDFALSTCKLFILTERSKINRYLFHGFSDNYFIPLFCFGLLLCGLALEFSDLDDSA